MLNFTTFFWLWTQNLSSFLICVKFMILYYYFNIYAIPKPDLINLRFCHLTIGYLPPHLYLNISQFHFNLTTKASFRGGVNRSKLLVPQIGRNNSFLLFHKLFHGYAFGRNTIYEMMVSEYKIYHVLKWENFGKNLDTFEKWIFLVATKPSWECQKVHILYLLLVLNHKSRTTMHPHVWKMW